ncbi:MAG: hypothetical protein Q9191_007559, partial [Dirinaria sp. TL-2023a]
MRICANPPLRARESRASAEAELLSSTSDNVCELWSGQEVVRALGEPRMKDFIIRTNIHGNKHVNDLPQSLDKGHYEKIKDNSRSRQKLQANHAQPAEDNEKEYYADEATEAAELLENKAPNITLNVKGSVASRAEIRVFAIFSTILQSLVLVVSALSVYHWRWKNGSNLVPQDRRYGYPCFLVGTTAVVAGLVLCSHVIEGTTTEQVWQPVHEEGTKYQVVKLQKSCTVSEQQFDSYAIFNSASDPLIRTSRLNKRNYNILAAVGTTLAIGGFIVQFIGLRALHWSSTVMQLGATLVLTAARAWVRRGLAKDPIAFSIPTGHELSWLAMHICGLKSWEIPTGIYDPNETPQNASRNASDAEPVQTLLESRFSPEYYYMLCLASWQSLAGGGPEALAGVRTDGFRAFHHEIDHTQLSLLRVRKKLETLMPEPDSTVRVANALATAIEKIMSLACNDSKISTQWENSLSWILQGGYFNWAIKAALTSESGECRCTDLVMSLKAEQRGTSDELKWCADRAELHAVLSLWVYSLINRTPEQNKKRPSGEISNRFASGWIDPTTRSEAGALSDMLYQAEHEVGRPCPVDLGQNMRFARIVNNESNSDSHWAQQAHRWIGRGVTTVAAGAPNGSHYRIRRDIEPWPVFGISYLSFQSLQPLHKRQPYCYEANASPLNNVVAEPDRMEHTEYVRMAAQEHHSAVISTLSLEENCALDIFSSFMLALANNITRIGGTTHTFVQPTTYAQHVPTNAVQSEDGLWFNSVIEAMVSIVVDSELTDRTTAYTIIIPALYIYDLLPKHVTDIQGRTDDHASPIGTTLHRAPGSD